MGGSVRRQTTPQELRVGRITSLAVKGAQSGRVSVYLDGQHAFDLDAVVAAEAGLRMDDVLTEERQAALLLADEPFRAREAGLSMLARREFSAGEIADRLRRTGFGEGAVGDTVAWLEERGYVDDRRFVAAYAADRLKAGWGRQRIVSELLRRGVDREVLAGDECGGLLERHGSADGMEQILALVKRRFAGQLSSDPAGAKRRIGGFLARRGHDWETISAVWRALREDGGYSGSDDASQG